MAEKTTQGNRSIEKAFQIIEVMAQNQKPMRLNDIACSVNIPSSTVLRMLTTLQSCGYVQQDNETLRYFITIKFCHLSNLVSRQMSIRNSVHPFLVELSESVGEYVTIGIESDMSLHYIDDVNARANHTALRVLDAPGRTAMLHCNGVGKLFLAEYDDKRLDYYIAKYGLQRFTINTLISKTELQENLRLIRENGYSVDNEENEIGIRSIAAPVRDSSGDIIAGIGIAVPTPRCTAEQLELLVPALLKTADKISRIFFK